MAYSPNSAKPQRIHPKEALKTMRTSASLTDTQKQAVLSTLADLFREAAALLWQTDPNDLQSALSAVPQELAPCCSILFPNGIPATDTAPIPTHDIVEFVYALQNCLFALTPKGSNSDPMLRKQCSKLATKLFAALYDGLGGIDCDVSAILVYINASRTMPDAKATPATDFNEFKDGFSNQSIPKDPSQVAPLMTAAGFSVRNGMVTLAGNPSQFAIVLQHAWTVYLHDPAAGEAKLRRTAAGFIPAAHAPEEAEPVAAPVSAPVPSPAPQSVKKQALKWKREAIYLSSQPLDIHVKLALVHILGDLTKDVKVCEMLWAAVREAHQAAGIKPEDFAANLSLGEDQGTNYTTASPAKILDARCSIDTNRDPYRQLDIPAWFKYLRYGGSRVASRVGSQITYAQDQDQFFAYFHMQDVLASYLDPTEDKGRYLRCDYTGYLYDAAQARNLTSHNSPDSVDQLTLGSLMDYLNGWVGSLEPLCGSTPWQYQADMIVCKENLVKQFFRALDTVSYQIDTFLDYLGIPAAAQPRVEQLLDEAGFTVTQGMVEIMGHMERFAAALRSAWDLAQTDWKAGARTLHKQMLQTRQEIESQKLNMEALRMDVLLELAQSGDLDAQLEAGKRYWNASPRNEEEAGHWFKAAIRNCPNDPEANYRAACYYLDRDSKTDDRPAQPVWRSRSVTTDAEEAVLYLRNAAQQGHAGAQVLLGQCYENAQGFPHSDPEAAFDLYRQAAQQHHAEGLYHLGRCYENRIGTDEDLSEALYCYKEAAIQNHLDAQCAMARFYLKGYVVKFDYDRAVRIYEELVEQGHVQAMVELANCFSTHYSTGAGEEHPAKTEKAQALYERAANLGSTTAMIKLGEHLYGKDSISWLTRAAEAGDVEAQYKLAQQYHWGKDTQQNPQEAFRWYLAAAKQGHSWATAELVDCYANGFGAQENMDEAWFWSNRATPYSLHTTAHKLASAKACFLNDSGYDPYIPRQLEQAVTAVQQSLKDREFMVASIHSTWGKRAIRAIVEDDNCPGLALARYELADSYERGLGIPSDPAAAFQWYGKAAKLGLKKAMCAMGRCYEQGIGVDADESLAAQWYRKAAEAGHAPAQYEWGRCLESGIGSAHDAMLAFQWYQKSAEGGCAQGQYALARCCQPSDPEAAHRWYQAAAEQGHEQAALKLAAYFAAHSLEDDNNVNLAWRFCSSAFNHENVFTKNGALLSHLSSPGDLTVSEMFRDAMSGIPSEDVPLSMVADLTAEERELIEAVFQYQLGHSHQTHWNDPEQTVACYENAVRMGLKFGLVSLGECHERGFGDVPMDHAKAKEYYRQAAALGSATAAERFAELDPDKYLATAESFHYGSYGNEPHYATAKHFYQIAASLGSATAVERLAELEQLGY